MGCKVRPATRETSLVFCAGRDVRCRGGSYSRQHISSARASLARPRFATAITLQRSLAYPASANAAGKTRLSDFTVAFSVSRDWSGDTKRLSLGDSSLRSTFGQITATFCAFENINSDLSCGQSFARQSVGLQPCRALRMLQKAPRNKAGARGINVTVTSRILSMRKEALRHDEAQIVFCACHGDVEPPPLVLHLGCGSGAKIGWHAAVNNVENEHRFPFPDPWRNESWRGPGKILVEKRHTPPDHS
jgi:hypothetical protein